jgi:carbon-monoxide dehydrogenase large subunit
VNVGLSANDASSQVKKKALKLASILLDKNEDTLELSDGAVRVRSDSNQFITLADLALQLSPAVAGKLPDGFDSAGLEAVSYLSSDYMPHSSGANIAKVEVDIVTGGIKILDYYVVHDCGRILNPMIVDGQIIGGVVHGIGNAMFEQMVYDDAGNPMTTNYGDYLLPLASEMPEIHVAHIETPSPANPMGLKGAGEGGTIPAIGAMINAIEDALTPFDAYIAQYPVTPEYILELVDSEKIAAE